MESETLRSCDSLSYSMVSALAFAALQLLLFPAMVVSAGLQLDLLYEVTALQSIVLTSIVYYLISGTFAPGTIYLWYLIAVPFYAAAGWFFGLLLQNRFEEVRPWTKLLGSLVLFESALGVAVIMVERKDMLGLAGGW